MKITTLLTVKNYEAGRDGNLLIAIDDEMIAKAYNINGKVLNVKPLICTAYIRDKNAQEKLKKHTNNTPFDRVIVVNKKFQSLFNKTQLILLERQNALEDVVDPDTDVEVRVYADVAAMAKYGALRSKIAFHKAGHIMEKAECKIGRKLHAVEKKSDRNTKKNLKKATKEESLGKILNK